MVSCDHYQIWYSTRERGDFFFVRLCREQQRASSHHVLTSHPRAAGHFFRLRHCSHRPRSSATVIQSTGAWAGVSDFLHNWDSLRQHGTLKPAFSHLQRDDSWLLKPCSILLRPSSRGSYSQGACLWPCPNSEEVSHFRW